MVDTETCGDLENPYVYDLGMQVIDRQGKVYAQYSLVIFDIFVGMYDLMKTAYYSNKIPQYITDINRGKRKICYWVTAKRIIKELFKKYDITHILTYKTTYLSQILAVSDNYEVIHSDSRFILYAYTNNVKEGTMKEVEA